MTTVPSGSSSAPGSVPPLFAAFVDDTSLLLANGGAGVDAVVEGYLDARDGDHGDLLGRLACPVSRLSPLVTELARSAPAEPVDLALVVDSGLGAVPKALSTVFSRATLLTPRSVETSAPLDLDPVWLERVAEFVPDDVVAVVEPRRPITGDPEDVAAWLDAVRRVAEHGCEPKLRCGGPRPSDVPSVDELRRFFAIAAETGRAAALVGLGRLVRSADEAGVVQHGILNVLVAAARTADGAEGAAVVAALESTDAAALVAATRELDGARMAAVRKVLSRCGAGQDEVTALGALAA
ncbi:hypothetical protein ACFQ34_00965 [Pseudonocardia benzenivorans]|uniref:Uncharacterized protein n=1 Tax=Pseudonocardia benzenivorans TaxID=228005 RepID=A0ABW3VCU8_9PSEU